MNNSLQQGSLDFDGDCSFCEMNISNQVQAEFQHAEFNDTRLTDRLVQIGDELGSWLESDLTVRERAELQRVARRELESLIERSRRTSGNTAREN